MPPLQACENHIGKVASVQQKCGHDHKMPEFEQIVPVLKVSHLQRAVDFYTQVVGLDLRWRAGNDGGGENALLENGPVQLLLSTGSHLGDTPAFTGALYFNLKGVDAFYEAVKDRVEIVWPIETMEYGQREFGVRDPDGYLLAFAESLPESGASR
jgi:uncharacterized glyoxalase superfamily protein PhnB